MPRPKSERQAWEEELKNELPALIEFAGGRTIRTLAWARASFLSAGAAVCLAGCITGAPIPPTYTQDELKMICERNGGSWYRDDLMGGFCERR